MSDLEDDDEELTGSDDDVVDPLDLPVPTTCPSCGAVGLVVPIVYGEPDREVEEMAQRGECRLGGCCVYDDMPCWACRACDHEWR